MSQENVEAVQALFDTWNAGDINAFRASFDPDATIVRGLEGWPEPGPFVGRDAIVRQFERVGQAWDASTLEATSLIDGGDRIVVRWAWHGAGHGPEWKMEASAVCTVRQGKVLQLAYFWDHADALKSAGLSE
jgi:ketosteroid isomerase-like protein